MEIARGLTPLEEKQLNAYTSRSWDDLEEREQLNYALLLFKQSGRIDAKSKEAILTQIEGYRTTPEKLENTDFDKLAHAHLDLSPAYQPYEYMYLVWLNEKRGWKTRLTKPHPAIIGHKIEFSEFSEQFGTNQHRASLLSSFKSFMDDFKSRENTDKVQVIIGGSFVTDKITPSDIDFAIVIEESLLSKGFNMSNMRYMANYGHIKGLDYYFIRDVPANSSFYEYNIFHRLANGARHKEKGGSTSGVRNNVFTPIKLFKVDL